MCITVRLNFYHIILPSKNMIPFSILYAFSNIFEINLSLSPWYLLKTSDGRIEKSVDVDSFAVAWTKHVFPNVVM